MATHVHQPDGENSVSALAWLVAAGADTLVEETPRNWLAERAEPVRAAITSATPVASRPAVASRAAVAAPAAVGEAVSLAAAADSLSALDLAVMHFDHPLRQQRPPALLVNAKPGGIVIVADQPEPDDSPAARLRARMLGAIGIGAADHGLLHLLAWPLPGGRAPRPDEIAAYSPFIARALQLAQPSLLLALGGNAAALAAGLMPARGINSMRGRWASVDNIPLLATFHPRGLLTQPELKRLAWADLQAFAQRMPR